MKRRIKFLEKIVFMRDKNVSIIHDEYLDSVQGKLCRMIF